MAKQQKQIKQRLLRICLNWIFVELEYERFPFTLYSPMLKSDREIDSPPLDQVLAKFGSTFPDWDCLPEADSAIMSQSPTCHQHRALIDCQQKLLVPWRKSGCRFGQQAEATKWLIGVAWFKFYSEMNLVWTRTRLTDFWMKSALYNFYWHHFFIVSNVSETIRKCRFIDAIMNRFYWRFFMVTVVWNCAIYQLIPTSHQSLEGCKILLSTLSSTFYNSCSKRASPVKLGK